MMFFSLFLAFLLLAFKDLAVASWVTSVPAPLTVSCSHHYNPHYYDVSPSLLLRRRFFQHHQDLSKKDSKQQQRQQQLIHQQRLVSSRLFASSDPTTDTSRSTTNSQLTDWVVENLESESSSSSTTEVSSSSSTTTGNKITSSSATRAGENDTLPLEGLIIGSTTTKLRILAADSPFSKVDCDNVQSSSSSSSSTTATTTTSTSSTHTIRLLVGRNGWGTGVHPTTRLCLEWICQVLPSSAGNVNDDDDDDDGDDNGSSKSSIRSTRVGNEEAAVLLDYGCGSGILSIAALHLGARKCIGVDVEAEALVTAERNLLLNGYGHERFQLLHTREVQVFDPTILLASTSTGTSDGSGGNSVGVDLCVANILIGQLVRPSMVAALMSNIKPGGLLCLSGIRPNEVQALRQAYEEHMEEWLDDEYYAELDASETEGSLESYGFDCGRWARLVGRKKRSSSVADMIASLSELAVS